MKKVRTVSKSSQVEDREIKFRTGQDMYFAELILVHYLDWHFWMAVCFVLFVSLLFFGGGFRGVVVRQRCSVSR